MFIMLTVLIFLKVIFHLSVRSFNLFLDWRLRWQQEFDLIAEKFIYDIYEA